MTKRWRIPGITHRILLMTLLAAGGFLVGCAEEQQQAQRLNFEKKGRTVPAFSADSAYQFIEKQLAFGPRNPGSNGHGDAKDYFIRKFESYAGAGSAYSQEFTAEGYHGDTLRLSNIIASFNPGEADRIMLCAHWDTRPRADQDSTNADQPIPGADDGASGVGVLLALARLFQ